MAIEHYRAAKRLAYLCAAATALLAYTASAAHAEIVAIRQASRNLNRSRFEGATMYSTLQPCGMCTMAAIWAGVSRIVYGAERGQVNEMYFENRNLDIMDFVRDAFKDDLTLTGGLLGDRCAEMYYGPQDNPPQKEQANK